MERPADTLTILGGCIRFCGTQVTSTHGCFTSVVAGFNVLESSCWLGLGSGVAKPPALKNSEATVSLRSERIPRGVARMAGSLPRGRQLPFPEPQTRWFVLRSQHSGGRREDQKFKAHLRATVAAYTSLSATKQGSGPFSPTTKDSEGEAAIVDH